MKQIRRSIPINDELWLALKEVAKQENKSVSYLIRLFCINGLNNLTKAKTLQERLVNEHSNNDQQRGSDKAG